MRRFVSQWRSCFVLCYKSSAPLSFTAVRFWPAWQVRDGRSVWRILSWELSPVLAGPRWEHFLRGGAPQPVLGRHGKARGQDGTLQHPSPRPQRLVLAAPSLPAGRSGAPSSRRDYQPGRTFLSVPMSDPVSLLCGCDFFTVSSAFIFIQPMMMMMIKLFTRA